MTIGDRASTRADGSALVCTPTSRSRCTATVPAGQPASWSSDPGCATAYADDIRAPSHVFATAVHAGLLAAGFHRSPAYGGDGYDVRRDLGTLNLSVVPTVMVELGNMRNAADARCMTRQLCRGRYADGLARHPAQLTSYGRKRANPSGGGPAWPTSLTRLTRQ